MDGARNTTLNAVDRLDPARAAALLATLGITTRPPTTGEPLPPFAHHLYFWQAEPPASLGPDGHPAKGGLIPDLGLPRRMWAGGRLTFHTPLLAGIRAERRTQVVSITQKTGRSGQLGFVTLRHDIHQRGMIALTEEQDLVYRPADAEPAEPPQAPQDAEETRQVTFDATMLFRYSALTFNGHRIYYDADYARDVEGYPGLVIHGPLLAQHLMLMAQDRQGVLSQFAFRATAPLCLPEHASLCARGGTYWVAAPDGRQCMIAEAG